jgi:predicted phosphodiesterase
MRRIVTMVLACALALAATGCGESSAPSGQATVIWAVGDGGVPNDPSRDVVQLMTDDDPDHVIYLGDVYETGTKEEFETFGTVWGSLLKRTWPTPGNHDWAEHRAGYDPFWAAVRGQPLPFTYKRRVAGWEIVAANSETPDDAAQRRWLQLQASGGGNCRIFFWHRPRFNAGEHEDEELQIDGMWNIVKRHAAILLAGHDHNMQRFKPVDGTVQYISGAGGRSHYPVDEKDPRLAFSDSTADGALRIALRPGKADLRFIATDGTELDRSTVTCQG